MKLNEAVCKNRKKIKSLINRGVKEMRGAAVTLAASSLCLWLGLSGAGLLLGLWLRTGLFAKSMMSPFL